MLEFGKIVYGDYKISSFPFTSKVAAYEEIQQYWQGCDVTTWFDKRTKEYYIVSK